MQIQELTAIFKALGNHSMPIHTYRWANVAISNEETEQSLIDFGKKHYSGYHWRIEDNNGNGVIYEY